MTPVKHWGHLVEEEGPRCCFFLWGFALVFGWCTVCHCLLAIPLGVIGRICSVVMAFSVHFLYYSLLLLSRLRLSRKTAYLEVKILSLPKH